MSVDVRRLARRNWLMDQKDPLVQNITLTGIFIVNSEQISPLSSPLTLNMLLHSIYFPLEKSFSKSTTISLDVAVIYILWKTFQLCASWLSEHSEHAGLLSVKSICWKVLIDGCYWRLVQRYKSDNFTE